MSARVAAFFDLDGTLMLLPSLERRLFRMLHYRGQIPWRNYVRWLREALRLFPYGLDAVLQANKTYLRGMRSFEESGTENPSGFSGRKTGHQDEGRASTPSRHTLRWPVPRFLEEGVERVTCHAMLGHRIVIVSGTLEPLAKAAAQALEAETATRGFATQIGVRATRLEERNGKWTGQILGEPMFGPAKARVLYTLAEEMSLDLSQCWAYGDSSQDRWMLAAVGNPVAVNPGLRLARIARKRAWPIWRTTDRVQQMQNLVPQTERCG